MKVLCGLILLSFNLVFLEASCPVEAPSECTCVSAKEVYCTNVTTITSIPSWIPNGTEHLELTKCNVKSITKDSFKNLTSLVYINLKNQKSGLSIVDSAVFQGLENLTRVYLRGNAITSLPAGLFANFTKLRTVFLGDNQLQTLPDDLFQNSPNVQLFDVSNTLLSKEVLGKIGQGKFGRNIKGLNIKGTRILELTNGFFSGLPHLTFLNMENCEINYIREDVVNGTKINMVNFEGNPIQSIDANAFRGVALKEFKCPKCNLTSEAINFIKNIKSLESLRLEHNRITNIPKNAFSGLVNLDDINLSNNTIETIEKDAFADLPKCNNEQTECIQLQQNPLKCDCNLAWFHDWTKKWQYRDQLKCKTPDSVSGKNFTALNVSQFCCLNGTKCGNPMPTGTTPNPTGTTPNPTGTTPNPTGTTPNPTGTTPNPTGTTPNPTGTTPNPTGTTPNPNHASALFASFTKIATEMAFFGLITYSIF